MGLKEMAEPTMKLLTVTAVKIQLIMLKTTLKRSPEVGVERRLHPEVKGHKHVLGSSLLFPCGGSEGEGKEGGIITVEKVLSWRFCRDPADSPIP